MSRSEPWWERVLRQELEAFAPEQGVELLSLEAHHERWMSGLKARQGSPFAMAQLRGTAPDRELLPLALDAAAGVLVELPRIEADAWRGWGDARLERVWALLQLAELPEEAPRVALAACWARLRAQQPFVLELPSPGAEPQSLDPLLWQIGAYLDGLQELVGRAGAAEDLLGAGLLAERLELELRFHRDVFERRTRPLAQVLYGACLPSQRAALGVARGREDRPVLEEGRPLRHVEKLRVHLAAWVLAQAGLPRATLGLVLRHFGAELATALPDEEEDGPWRRRLAKEVDYSLAYWKQPAREAREQLAVLESEVFDLLCPAGG